MSYIRGFEKNDIATCIHNYLVENELTEGETYNILDYTSMFKGWVTVTNNLGEIQNYPAAFFKKD